MSIVTSNISNSNEISWKNTNINVLSQSASGGGTITSGVLTLPAGTTEVFNLTSALSDNQLQYIKLKCVMSTSSDNTDYNYNNFIKLYGTGTSNDETVNIKETVLFKFDDEEYYENTLIFGVNKSSISSLYLRITNNSDYSIEVSTLVFDYDYIKIDSSNIDTAINDWAEDNFESQYDNMVSSTGTYIEPRTSDPSGSELYVGRIWLRTDLIS